jgi:hypothetical protein
MSRTIVAFTGYAKSGKDTAARYLRERHGYTKVAFADALRRLCARLFGWPLEWFEDDALKEQPLPTERWPLPWSEVILSSGRLALAVKDRIDVREVGPRARDVILQHNYRPVTPREVLQLVGTDILRALRPTIWLEAWQEEAAHHERVVVTDCRFINEAALVRSLGGVVVRVHRQSAGARSGAGHMSEREIDLIVPDYEIHNEGTEEELWSQVEALMEQRNMLGRAA